MTIEEQITDLQTYKMHKGEDTIYVKRDDVLKVLEQEPDTWSLEDAREDFVDDVYNTLDFLPTNDEANQIIDSFDRVTSSIRREPCENCISKEAALNTLDYIDKVLDEDRTVEKYKEMLKECYEVLPSVTSQQTSTLDKIRAEIYCHIIEDDTSGNTPARLRADWAAANKAHLIDIAILDKYKRESEDKE